jgi:hypothetical protein
VAAAGLAVYGAAAVVVCRDVLRVALPARGRSVNGLLLAAACLWLPAVVGADVLAVLTGRWWLLDALGVVTLVGVLGQAIIASLGYVGPLLWRRSEARPAVRVRMDRLPLTRAAAYNLGVAALALAAVTALPAAVGLALVASVVVTHVVLLSWPPRAPAAV